jgi:hypothetical protein
MGLTGSAVTSNLPTLPDGTPNPNYNPKGFAGYAAPSAGMTGALTGYGDTIGNDYGFGGYTSKVQDLINQPGSLEKMGINPQNFITMSGGYLGGAGKAAAAMDAQLKARRQYMGQQALASLNNDMGATGNLGGTVAGIGKLDLAGRYAQQATQDTATVAAAKEAAIRGRMQDILSGGGMMLNNLGQERTGNLMAEQNLANLSLQQKQQILDAYARQYGLESDLTNRPMDYAMQQSQGWMTRPNQASDLDAALAGIGAGASMASGLGWAPLA